MATNFNDVIGAQAEELCGLPFFNSAVKNHTGSIIAGKLPSDVMKLLSIKDDNKHEVESLALAASCGQYLQHAKPQDKIVELMDKLEGTLEHHNADYLGPVDEFNVWHLQNVKAIRKIYRSGALILPSENEGEVNELVAKMALVIACIQYMKILKHDHDEKNDSITH